MDNSECAGIQYKSNRLNVMFDKVKATFPAWCFLDFCDIVIMIDILCSPNIIQFS